MSGGAASRLLALASLVLIAGACSEPEPVARAEVLPAVPAAQAAPPDGDALSDGDAVLCVDTARSTVRWRGTKIGGSHEGVVRLAGGELRLREGRVTGGAFTVDMRTIAVTDIPPHEVEARRQLRSHLAHEEFFAVDRFPSARFVLARVEAGDDGRFRVSGELTLRDSTHRIAFAATAPVLRDDEVRARAAFSIDRQRWGVDFDGRTSMLREAIVNDVIRLELVLVARRAACGAVREARAEGA